MRSYFQIIPGLPSVAAHSLIFSTLILSMYVYSLAYIPTKEVGWILLRTNRSSLTNAQVHP